MNKIGGIATEQLQGTQVSTKSQSPEVFEAIMAELISNMTGADGEMAEEAIPKTPSGEKYGDNSEEIKTGIDEKTVFQMLSLINSQTPIETTRLNMTIEQSQDSKTLQESEGIKIATAAQTKTLAKESDYISDPHKEATAERTESKIAQVAQLSGQVTPGKGEMKVSDIFDSILGNSFTKVEPKTGETVKSDPIDLARSEELKSAVIQSEAPRISDGTRTEEFMTNNAKTISFEANINKLEETIVKSITAIKEGEHSILKVKLQPENLGKVDLDVTMENGKLTAKINVESNHIRDLFNENLSQLHQGLLKQNIQVGRIIVEVNPGNDTAQWNFEKQGNFRHGNRRTPENGNRQSALKSISEIRATQDIRQTGLDILA